MEDHGRPTLSEIFDKFHKMSKRGQYEETVKMMERNVAAAKYRFWMCEAIIMLFSLGYSLDQVKLRTELKHPDFLYNALTEYLDALDDLYIECDGCELIRRINSMYEVEGKWWPSLMSVYKSEGNEWNKLQGKKRMKNAILLFFS